MLAETSNSTTTVNGYPMYVWPNGATPDPWAGGYDLSGSSRPAQLAGTALEDIIDDLNTSNLAESDPSKFYLLVKNKTWMLTKTEALVVWHHVQSVLSRYQIQILNSYTSMKSLQSQLQQDKIDQFHNNTEHLLKLEKNNLEAQIRHFSEQVKVAQNMHTVLTDIHGPLLDLDHLAEKFKTLLRNTRLLKYGDPNDIRGLTKLAAAMHVQFKNAHFPFDLAVADQSSWGDHMHAWADHEMNLFTTNTDHKYH